MSPVCNPSGSVSRSLFSTECDAAFAGQTLFWIGNIPVLFRMHIGQMYQRKDVKHEIGWQDRGCDGSRFRLGKGDFVTVCKGRGKINIGGCQ